MDTFTSKTASSCRNVESATRAIFEIFPGTVRVVLECAQHRKLLEGAVAEMENGGFVKAAFAYSPHNFLREILICYDKNYRFISCPPGGTPAAQRVHIRFRAKGGRRPEILETDISRPDPVSAPARGPNQREIKRQRSSAKYREVVGSARATQGRLDH
ncbi:MAG: hypothetical protein ACREVK_02185 [Gammaproteobacteria bacterium]